MNITDKDQPQLSRILVAVIVGFALLPALLISVGFVSTLQEVLVDQSQNRARLQADAVGGLIAADITGTMERVVEIGSDNDVAQASRNGAFAGYATAKLDRWLVREQSGVGAVIFDSLGVATEASPIEYLLYDLSAIDSQLQDFLKTNLLADHTDEIKVDIISLSFDEGGSRSVVTFMTPLHLVSLKDAPTTTLTGALVMFIDVDEMVDKVSGTLDGARLFSIVINDHDAYNSQYDRGDYITYVVEQDAGADVSLVIEVGVPKSMVSTQVNKTIIQLSLVLAALLTAVLIVSFIVAKRLLAPFKQLSNLVARISLGDYGQSSVDVRYREPAQLLALVNRLTSRVIEDQAQLECKVLERTELLRSTNVELSDTLEQLRKLQSHLVETEKNAQLGQLVAGVAHEINTPLGISLTATTTMADDLRSIVNSFDAGKLKRSELQRFFGRSDEVLSLLEYNLHRGAELVRTFKEVSVDQSSGYRRIFGLGTYVREVVASLKAETKKYQVEIEVKGDESLELDSYPGAFSHIICNFVLNSLKHGFEKSQIHRIAISYEVTADNLTLSYEDDGAGVSDEVMSRLFEPFFTTGRNRGCTGLGMHIVYNMVTQKLGGKITASHGQSGGLRFVITAPLTPA
ncbi:HAMP domain-containing histidine kinase [Corallincola luteus]|uniref:histidine kinase n=1 Tax=Corallincola luteus TaxID=1775177 RepID=A0ABY2AKA5_9GAMM|nr:HAMP domain-containing sensor histidine kinase [Corallincola luteus]TCI03270.1 HAMP domain-containing histidine kinase [Corallincola luteus]